jgi:hypothetical protein
MNQPAQRPLPKSPIEFQAQFCYFNKIFLFSPPLSFAERKWGVHEKWISRRCLPCTSMVQGLRRNLPFLPVLWQAPYGF